MNLMDALLKDDTGGCIQIINRALDAGSDPRQYARQVVDSLRAVLLVKLTSADQIEATKEELDKLNELAKRFSPQKLLAAIRAFDHAAQHASIGWQPGLQLELAALRSIDSGEEPSGSGSEVKPALNNPVNRHSTKNLPQNTLLHKLLSTLFRWSRRKPSM